MRLVFITQKVDDTDPVLGATVAKLRALAERCDELVVLCLSVGEHDLPPNTSFATFAASTRFRRGLRFVRVLLPAIRRRPDAIVAHMCPIYLVLAAPFAKPLRVPLLIWYTHWAIDRTLRLATYLCDAALSVDRRSYPLESAKVRALGHGIDVRAFAARNGLPEPASTLRLLAPGRTSPSKGFMTLLEALSAVNATLEIRGASTTAEERAHREELTRRVAELGLDERVRIEPPIPRGSIPALMRSFDAVVNPTRGQTHGGALDKVVYEAAACAVPVIACNPHFDRFLGDLPVELRFRSADPDDLAAKLRAFAASAPAARAAAGLELRRRVEADHSVETWSDGVLRVVSSLGRRGRSLDS